MVFTFQALETQLFDAYLSCTIAPLECISPFNTITYTQLINTVAELEFANNYILLQLILGTLSYQIRLLEPPHCGMRSSIQISELFHHRSFVWQKLG
jgi:4-amino-4-deoxy-L-arabinose transferase-like glycosyltransferase